jgi:hypothetical protein
MSYVACSSHFIPWMHSIKLTANIVILTLSRSCRSCTNIFIFSRSACSCWWDKISTSSDLGGSSGLLKPACRQEHAINHNNHKITKHRIIHKLLQIFVTHTNIHSPLTQLTECIRERINIDSPPTCRFSSYFSFTSLPLLPALSTLILRLQC